MKIALLSDIHGNPIALDAALDDIAAQSSIDQYWILGDLVAAGFDPIGVLQRIDQLPNVVCTVGNNDLYLTKGVSYNFPDPKPTSEREWLHQVGLSRNMGFTYGQVWAVGKQQFIADLPLEHRITLPDGTRVLGVHASPGQHSGKGFRPDQSEAIMLERMSTANADLVIVGHTHWPMNRMIGNVHLVNLGSISNQYGPDLRTKYAILEADEHGYAITHRYVAYDRAACVAYCEQYSFPGADFVGRYCRGEYVARWIRGRSSAELRSLLPTPNKRYTRASLIASI